MSETTEADPLDSGGVGTAEEVFVECDVIELSDEEYYKKPKRRKRVNKPGPAAQCEICSKMYGDKYILKRHMMTHTGERAFVCSICGNSFRHRHTLRAHESTHQDPDIGRIYTCFECGSTFKRPYTLRTHMRIHSGVKPHHCTLCSKSFTQRSNLLQHVKAHNNERNHACDQCDKRFMTNSKLKRHYQRHVKKTSLAGVATSETPDKVKRKRKAEPKKLAKSSCEDSVDDND